MPESSVLRHGLQVSRGFKGCSGTLSSHEEQLFPTDSSAAGLGFLLQQMSMHHANSAQAKRRATAQAASYSRY